MAKVIKQRISFQNQPIGVLAPNRAKEQALLGIANEVNQLNNIAFKEMEKQAIKKGEEEALKMPMEKFYTLNEEGNFSAYSTDIFKNMGSVAQESFRAVSEKKYLKSVEDDIKTTAKEYRAKYSGQVGSAQSFNDVMSNYSEQIVNQAPDKFKELIKETAKYTIADHVADLNLKNIAVANARHLNMADTKFAELTVAIQNAETPDLRAALIDQLRDTLDDYHNIESYSGEARANNVAAKAEKKFDALVLYNQATDMMQEFDPTLDSVSELTAVQLYLEHGIGADNIAKVEEDGTVTGDLSLLEELKNLRSKFSVYNKKEVVGVVNSIIDRKKAFLKSTKTEGKDKNARNNILVQVNKLSDGITNKSLSEISMNDIANFTNEADNLALNSNGSYSLDNVTTAKNRIISKIANKVSKEFSKIGMNSQHFNLLQQYFNSGRESLLNQNPVGFDLKPLGPMPEEAKALAKEIYNKFDGKLDFAQFNRPIMQQLGTTKELRNDNELAIVRALEKITDEETRKRVQEAALGYQNEYYSLASKVEELFDKGEYEQGQALVDQFVTKIEKAFVKGKESEISLALIGRYKTTFEQLRADATEDDFMNIVTQEAGSGVRLIQGTDGLFRINTDRVQMVKDLISFIRSPGSEELRNKLPDNIVEAYDKVYKIPGTTGLNQKLTALAGALTTENAGASQAVKDKNFVVKVLDSSHKPSTGDYGKIDDLIFEPLIRQNWGNYDETQTPDANYLNYLKSEDSLLPITDDNPMMGNIYSLMRKGYFSEQFLRLLDNNTNLNNDELGVVMSHVDRMMKMRDPISNRPLPLLDNNEDIHKYQTLIRVARITGIVTENDNGNISVMDQAPLLNTFRNLNQMSNEDMRSSLNTLIAPLDLDVGDGENFRINTVVDALLNKTKVLKKGAVYPKEIKDLAKFYWGNFIMTPDSRTTNPKIVYKDFKSFVKEYMDTQYQPTDGNILDFSQQNVRGIRHTKYHLNKYFVGDLYLESINYINGVLPEGFIFDPETAVSPEYQQAFDSPFDDEVPSDQVSGFSQSQMVANGMMNTRGFELQSPEQIAEFLREQNMKKVFLVAEPTNQQDEIIYQAYYYDGNQPKPVLVTNQQDQTVPMIFSVRSIANALNTDGRYDAAFQRSIQGAIDERNDILERYGFSQ